MKNGNLSWYISRNPEVDRYNLIVQTAAAVAYLKENGVVHGDIKAQNFLVSEDHIVKLTDFGNSIVGLCSLRFTDSTSMSNVTLRWTAPEILLGETRHTFEGDVYTLGMTILEIITGSVPWDGVLDVTVIHNLNQKLQPPRPETSMPVGYQPSDRIWELMKKCWASESKQRPYATKVREELEDIIKQHQSNCSTHVNTHRTSDNVEAPTEPISSSTPVYGELQPPSPTQNTRKRWFGKRLSSMMFRLATTESVRNAPKAAKAETVDKINPKLQRKLEILERRRHQEERARERSRMVLAKRELILLAGDYDLGYWGYPLAMSRQPARPVMTASIAVTSKTDPGPRRPPQGGIFNEAGASPMLLPATLSGRSPRARSLTSFGQLVPESCTESTRGREGWRNRD
ncbi:Focal adhesion kinase 1 [Rhizoctonia solani]|uniref:Focal adhesion kinase 1 n=1 Tax=Rhizoctonia solani TaxID=456999 RepID=A0A0K6FQC3_9AGAM|nr:Focal adhesion kinase 1 [Rhizoctonia solani]